MLVAVLAASAGLAALGGAVAPRVALASATLAPAGARPYALRPQVNVPTLDEPGTPASVSYAPDEIRYGVTTVTVQAPPYTQITGLNLNCTFSCPVSIAADGQTATGTFNSSSWVFNNALVVTLAATGNAPLAGGQYSGTVRFGISSQPLTVNIAAGYQGTVAIYPGNGTGGISVFYVLPGSNAAKSGLLAGDLITTLNGQPVPNLATFSKILTGLRSGAVVPVTVRRGGQPVTFSLTLD
jgi:hypothetical protein